MRNLDTCLVLHIALENDAACEWGRVLLPGGASLWELHLTIQQAMGWDMGDLFAFFDAQGVEIRRNGLVAEFLSRPGDRLGYVYGCVPGWVHRVRVEQVQRDCREVRGGATAPRETPPRPGGTPPLMLGRLAS